MSSNRRYAVALVLDRGESKITPVLTLVFAPDETTARERVLAEVLSRFPDAKVLHELVAHDHTHPGNSVSDGEE